MSSTSAAAATLDSRTALAVSMHGQPGVYALLLGSGTSTAAGVPTGWGVIQQLVTRARVAAGETVSDDDGVDPVQWWDEHGDGQPLGYSNLLRSLAPTAAARRALLAGFFEPTDEERDAGQKIPGAAHRAIAELVQRGTVRVILTTNFDQLIEQALTAAGITFQVVATPSAITGMEPLTHARCTVIKLHGDFTRIDQLNTVDELSTYPPELVELLRRVLDEYGLVINGWSGDWDHALVQAIEATRPRRYPMLWASFGPLGAAGQRLVDEHRAMLVEGTDAAADTFFPDLVSRLAALDLMSTTPLNKAMAITRVKQLLPEPTKYIQLQDLFDDEITRIRDALLSRGQLPPNNGNLSGEDWQKVYDGLRDRSDTLLHMLAQGVYLDRHRQHSDLWVWVIQQLLRARPRTGNGQMRNEVWVNLHHYPAALALKAASLAAVAAGRDDVLLRLLTEPTWREEFGGQQERAAWDVLHDYRTVDPRVINAFPRWGSTGDWLYPQSHLFKAELRAVLLPILGDEIAYEQLYSRTEYRTALVSASVRHRSIPSCAGGVHRRVAVGRRHLEVGDRFPGYRRPGGLGLDPGWPHRRRRPHRPRGRTPPQSPLRVAASACR